MSNDQVTPEKRVTENSLSGLFAKHERLLIIFLIVFASLRVFFFSAAFPFFNNVDEHAHFDTVYKYSRGFLPHKGAELTDRDVDKYVYYYGTMYFITRPEDFPDGEIPPPASIYSRQQIYSIIDEKIGNRAFNHEAFSPPVYYMTAGLWFNLGKLAGIEGAGLLYWARFLNIPVIALLVLAAYFMARRFYPASPYMKIGLPFMAAFLPQDTFYSITNDVFSPLVLCLAFYVLLKIYFGHVERYRDYILAGLLTAVTFLIKYSNIAIALVFVTVLFMKSLKLHEKGKLKSEMPKMLTAIFTALVPVVFWLGRNYLVLGDLTGSASKIEFLTWTIKPFGEVFNHPIFTITGLATFWNDQMLTFWEGEITWHLKRLSFGKAELFYSVSSLVFLAAAAVRTFRIKKEEGSGEKFINTMSFLILVCSVGFLAFVSVIFDFGSCYYPSKDYPFMTSGRLISGMLVPFIILYLNGFKTILSASKIPLNPLPVIVIVMFLLAFADFMVSREVFLNPYNWFNFIETP